MSKRQEDFDKAANEYAEKMCAEYHGDDADKRISKYEFLNGAEYGYQYARKNLWFDAQGDNVPEYSREVIVIGRDGKIFYGHRPDPEEVTMIEGKPYHAKTYDKNGWNWPNIALWLDVEIPGELIEQITDKWFEENDKGRI